MKPVLLLNELPLRLHIYLTLFMLSLVSDQYRSKNTVSKRTWLLINCCVFTEVILQRRWKKSLWLHGCIGKTGKTNRNLLHYKSNKYSWEIKSKWLWKSYRNLWATINISYQLVRAILALFLIAVSFSVHRIQCEVTRTEAWNISTDYCCTWKSLSV